MFKGGYTIIDGKKLLPLYEHPSTNPMSIDKDLYYDIYNKLIDGKFNTIGVTGTFTVIKGVKNFDIQTGNTENVVTFTVGFDDTTDAKVTLTETIEQGDDDEIINNYWGSVDFISSGGGGGGTLYCHSISLATKYYLQVYSTDGDTWTFADLEDYARNAKYNIPVAVTHITKHLDGIDYNIVRASLKYTSRSVQAYEEYVGVAPHYDPDEQIDGYAIVNYTDNVLLASTVQFFDQVFEV